MSTTGLLDAWLERRLGPPARAWFSQTCAEIARGVPDERFGALLSAASRHARRQPLAPDDSERRRAAQLLEGFDPERWTLLETLRVRLVLSRPDLEQPSAERAMESAFRFADEGELCALYRSLAHFPDAGRFTQRAREGCRTNMRSVFEAAACDTPYPFLWFDEPSFNQCVLKAIFIGVPVARIFGLERRLNPELSRMALDFAAERRSAGRPVPEDLRRVVDPRHREAGASGCSTSIPTST